MFFLVFFLIFDFMKRFNFENCSLLVIICLVLCGVYLMYICSSCGQHHFVRGTSLTVDSVHVYNVNYQGNSSSENDFRK